MFRACLLLLAGLYAPQLSSFAADSYRVAALFVAGILLLAFRRVRAVAWLLLGSALFLGAAAGVIDSRIASGLVGDSIVTRVEIADFPVVRGQAVSFVAMPLDDARLPGRLRLTWFQPPVTLWPGDTWQLELRLRRPRGSSNPGVFDYERWLFRERIGAVGYVVDKRRNHLLDSGGDGAVTGWRQRFVQRVAQRVPETPRAAVLAAIVVGARHLITREQWERYARTGTSHLMAISGLHVGLAAAGGYLATWSIVGLLRWRGNQHAAAILVSMFAAVLYALIAGLAIPARRASLMITLAGLTLLCRRRPKPLMIISAACIAIAVTTPLATMAPGFMLSFLAVVVLLWLARRHTGTAAPERPLFAKARLVLRQLATVQVLLLMGLLPVTVLVFHRIAFAAPPVNFVAVPLFSFVTVPFALCGMLLDGPLEVIGDRALLIAAASIGVLEQLLEAAAAAQWAAPQVAVITGVGSLHLLLPLVWVAVPPGWPGRYLGWIGLLAIVLHAPRAPDPGCADVHIVDVGQGLAVVVRTARHAVLYDSGPAYYGGGSAAETTLLPFLSGQGIDRVDTFLISHADLDHAGGTAALLDGLEVDAIVAGEHVPDTRRTVLRCRAGDHWRYDGVNFRILHPPRDSVYEGNDASCVMRVEAGATHALLAGDIERDVERQLVTSGELDPVALVVVPHHGSGTSSTPAFVRALQPRFAIVSAGFANRWGLPDPDVIERWHAAGAEVLVTAASGAISLRMCKATERIEVREHRHSRRRIWQE